MKTYLGKDKWTEADGMKTAIADTTINARLKLVRRPTIWRRIISWLLG